AGELERMLAQVRQGRGVEPFETQRLTKSGAPVHLSVTLSPVRAPDGRIVGASSIARDISERLRAEEAIRSANGELARRNREMEEFVDSVSHDLKSPVVGLAGLLAMLRENDGRDRGETMQVLDMAEGTVERMRTTIRDILDLSRVGRVV